MPPRIHHRQLKAFECLQIRMRSDPNRLKERLSPQLFTDSAARIRL